MTLSLQELDSHLFKCADIIRDAVDPTDYKEFILPLVYYKAVSDEFEKQYEENVEKYDDKELARRPNLYDVPIVPEGYLWDDLRAVSDNVDQALNEAFDAVTDENPELQGVFRADYIDADALDDDRLGRLVEHLSTHDLDRDSIPPDMLGEAYMDLVRQFAEEEGKSGGQFFTPPHIVNLCVRLVDEFDDGMTFHDPTVGSGGMLIEAARYYREEQGGDSTKMTFTGQEVNPDIAAIAKMNLSIHGLDGQIEREDSLSKPAFTDEESNELTRFDRVLANFPFSADWDKDGLQDDPYERFDWHEKLPRADRGDYAFIMHMAKQLKHPGHDEVGGKAAIVIPHGVLFRKHEQRYRKPMLENDMVEAIVGLPENLFQNNSIPSAVLVLNTDKPAERKGEVQFIHAADKAFYEELSNQNELTVDGLDHIVESFREWTTEEHVSRTVSLDEIRENDYNLNIALYVDTTEPEEQIEISEKISKIRDLQSKRDELEEQISQHTEELLSEKLRSHKQEQTGTRLGKLPSDWDFVPIGDTVADGKYSFTDGARQTLKSDEIHSEGEARVILLQEVGEGVFDDSEPKFATIGKYEEISHRAIYSGEIVIAKMADPVARACLIPDTYDRYLLGCADVVRLVTNEEFDDRFVMYCLNSHSVWSQAVAHLRGAGRSRINLENVADLLIPKPPLEEQRLIADILDEVDEQIKTEKEVLGQYQHLKQGLVQSLLSGEIRTADSNIEVSDLIVQYG